MTTPYQPRPIRTDGTRPGTYEDANQCGVPLLRKSVTLRVAALVRELCDT
jgi:hypothetical protein